MKKTFIGSACAALLTAGCVSVGAQTSEGEAFLGDWGVETQHIDGSTAPGDDFFTYVNGGWVETTEIPAGFPSTGGFLELHLRAEAHVGEIIQASAATGTSEGSPEQQIGDLYASYVDVERLNERGLDPIREELNAVLATSSHEEAARWMGRPVHSNVVGLGILLDDLNPQRYLVHIEQSGLNLPERDYYLEDSERYQTIRAAYVDYITATFDRAGIADGRERAEAILAFETRIAEVSWDIASQRDPIAMYDLKTRDELIAYAPGFEWDAYVEELGLEDEQEFIVNTNTAVQAIAEIFADTSVSTLASWLAFNFVDNQSGLLSEDFDQAAFAFYGETVHGIPGQRSREDRGVAFVSGQFGETIGQIYVEQHFSQDQKDQMLELVGYLERAFDERIGNVEWMDEPTREEALHKLSTFRSKIGYPDVWRDFSSIEIRDDDLIGNVRRIGDWYWADSRSRLGGPRRDWEWGMSPQTVNAYYSPSRNEIVFPAAILDAPFFDPHADMAVNFGAIGGVIGHEIGHGFDDQGSQQDADGVLRNWWSEESREEFERRAQMLVEQYDEFSPVEGEYVSGAMTLGENIGDLGGLSIALYAYNLWLEDHGSEAPVIDGFTGEQRVFLGWAQAFRAKYTDDYLVAIMRGDVHSPTMYRVNGVVRNMDEWYRAFGVGPDDAMYLPPEERVSIW